MVRLLTIFGLDRGCVRQTWASGTAVGKLFMPRLHFFAGWDNDQACGNAQRRAHIQYLGPSLSPREWLERNKTSSWVTMRHIQLYLIICKKSYSGRVTHSLSWQKANTTTKKPLPKSWNCAALCLHLDALSSWALAVWQLVSPSTQRYSHRSRLNTVLPGQAALQTDPFPPTKESLQN